MQPDEFARAIDRKSLPERIEAIFHQGACADTTCDDGRYMIENNFTFSKSILHFALSRKVPFVYASSASVYGSSSAFAPSPENERPLNLYGAIQTRFRQSRPQRRRKISRALSPVFDTSTSTVRVNLTRARWRRWCISSIANSRPSGRARLFTGTDGYADGEQRRDFVFVNDIVRVNLALAEGPVRNGVFNVGTGHARTFNDVAKILIARLGAGSIDYVPFPESLAGKYQSFTQADLSGLRDAGYAETFSTLENGIAQSVDAWNREY